MSGVTVIASSRGTFNPAGKTLTFFPPPVAKGDLLLVVVAYPGADSYVLPAGWDQTHVGGFGTAIDVLVHQVGDNEAASLELDITLAAVEWQGVMIALRGANPGTVIEAFTEAQFVAQTNLNAPATSTQQAINLELCAWSTDNTDIPTVPAGFTSIDGFTTALATSRSFRVAYAVANTTGALPARTATVPVAATGTALSVVMRDRAPYLPAELYDPVPGNIGLRAVAGETNIALRFAEPGTALPADEPEQLDNLAPDPDLTSAPAAVVAWTGRGRSFDPAAGPASGLIANDLPNGNTLQQRDVTIRAIVALDLAAAAGGTMTLIARGTHDGSPEEPYCYGLELQEQAAHPGCVEMRWFWEDGAGVVHVQPAGVFAALGDGKYFVLAATRRWESTGRVVLRYYAGAELIAELVSTNGDIAGATTGHTTVGGLKSAGVWSNPFAGVIDELLVDAIEISGEELRQEHDRLLVHQPAGVDMFVGLMPIGAPWYKDPGDWVGRLVKLVGQALGQPIACTEAMRALWLPDAAPLRQIARWERICGIVPKPRDSLDTRRTRVMAFLARDNGFARPQVQAALAELLNQNPDDIQILEFSNVIQESFAGFSTQRWIAGDVGTANPVGIHLELGAPIGTDLRWEPTRAWCHLRMPIPMPATFFYASIKMQVDAIPVNTMAGLWAYNRRTNNALWFGVNWDGVNLRIGYRTFLAGVMGAFVDLAAAPATGNPVWLRVQQLTAPVGGSASYQLSWSTIGADTASMTSTTVALDFPDPEWIGVSAVGDDAATVAVDMTVEFQSFTLWAPCSTRPFFWYVLCGAAGADLDNANLVLRKLAPGHTEAAVAREALLLADDAIDGRCDRGPLGGL